MTREEEIAQRLAKATPGPWYHRQAGEVRHSTGDRYDWIADHPDQGKHKKVIVAREALYGGTPDYAFIAHAPADISYLLEAVASARREALEEPLNVVLARGGALVPVEHNAAYHINFVADQLRALIERKG